MAQTENPLDLSQYISGVTDRAYKNWGRADDQYKWAQDTYNKDRAVTDKVVNRGLETQDKFAGYADQDRAFWEGTYKPAMQRQMDYATQYTTPERMEANRAGAISQSNIAAQGASKAAEQNLMSFGIDPSAGRYAGLAEGLAANRAMHAAAAGTKSDRDTELLGQQFLANAINTGASLPGQVANQAGVSMAGGNQAVNAGLATTASGSSTMGTPLQWGSQGNDMYNQWMRAAQAQADTGLRGNELSLKQNEAASKESSGIGAAIGAGAGILGSVAQMAPMFMSDRRMKTDIQKVGDDDGLPMYAYRYKGDPKSYPKTVGPMAQDVQKQNPDQVAEVGGRLAIKYRAGGMVSPSGDDDDEPGEVHRGYRPGEDVDPQTEEVMRPRAWREPVDTSKWDPEMPDSDTNQTLDENHPELSLQDQDERNRRQWVPNYDDGGSVRDDRLINPRATPGMADVPVGKRGRASLGVTYDPSSRYGAVEGGYEHDVGRNTTLGVHGNVGKDIGPEGASARPDWGVGVRGRVRFADGGSVLDSIPDYITPFDPEGEGYDYKSAREAGLEPQYNPTPAAGDPGMRWPGREPGSGMQLKGRRHETFDHGIEQDRQQGYGLEKQNGRYYTQPFQQYAEGGEVFDEEEFADPMDEGMPPEEEPPISGNVVPPEASPSGGEETDDVHALVNEGEFIIPKDVVRWHGEKFFQKLIQKAHDEMAQPQEAEPEEGPPTAMAIAPPTFRSGGVSA